jgi:hypothetical protein
MSCIVFRRSSSSSPALPPSKSATPPSPATCSATLPVRGVERSQFPSASSASNQRGISQNLASHRVRHVLAVAVGRRLDLAFVTSVVLKVSDHTETDTFIQVGAVLWSPTAGLQAAVRSPARVAGPRTHSQTAMWASPPATL